MVLVQSRHVHANERNLLRETTDVASSIHVSAMPDPEHEDHQLVILNVVDNSVVADADTKLTATSLELDATRRTWFASESLDRIKQLMGRRPVELPDGFRRGGDVTDRVRHRTGSGP